MVLFLRVKTSRRSARFIQVSLIACISNPVRVSVFFLAIAGVVAVLGGGRGVVHGAGGGLVHGVVSSPGGVVVVVSLPVSNGLIPEGEDAAEEGETHGDDDREDDGRGATRALAVQAGYN